MTASTRRTDDHSICGAPGQCSRLPPGAARGGLRAHRRRARRGDRAVASHRRRRAARPRRRWCRRARPDRDLRSGRPTGSPLRLRPRGLDRRGTGYRGPLRAMPGRRRLRPTRRPGVHPPHELRSARRARAGGAGDGVLPGGPRHRRSWNPRARRPYRTEPGGSRAHRRRPRRRALAAPGLPGGRGERHQARRARGAPPRGRSGEHAVRAARQPDLRRGDPRREDPAGCPPPGRRARQPARDAVDGELEARSPDVVHRGRGETAAGARRAR